MLTVECRQSDEDSTFNSSTVNSNTKSICEIPKISYIIYIYIYNIKFEVALFSHFSLLLNCWMLNVECRQSDEDSTFNSQQFNSKWNLISDVWVSASFWSPFCLRQQKTVSSARENTVLLPVNQCIIFINAIL